MAEVLQGQSKICEDPSCEMPVVKMSLWTKFENKNLYFHSVEYVIGDAVLRNELFGPYVR